MMKPGYFNTTLKLNDNPCTGKIMQLPNRRTQVANEAALQ